MTCEDIQCFAQARGLGQLEGRQSHQAGACAAARTAAMIFV
jgi:hypothetical protein